MDLNITPVAGQIKPASNLSLADMVNIGRGVQSYKSGQIALEQQTVGNEEQRKIAEAMKQDPGLLMTDNRLDMDKVNKIIPQLAPRTGSKYIQEYSTLHNAQTQALEAKRGMNQNLKSTVGTRFRILGDAGVPDPQAYIAEGELLKKEYPDQPDLHKYVDAALTSFKMAQPGPQVAQMAIRGAQSLMTPSEVENVFGPKTSTMNLGTDIKQVTTKATPGGLPSEVTMGKTLDQAQIAPSGRFVDTGQVDQDNNRIMIAYGKDGSYQGTVVAKPGSGIPGAPPAPGQPAPAANAQQPMPGAPIVGGPMTQSVIQGQPLAPIGQITPSVPQQPGVPAGVNYAAPRMPPPGYSPAMGGEYMAQVDAARAASAPSKIGLNNIDTVLKYLPMAATGQSSDLIAAIQSLGGNIAGSKPEEVAAAARDIIQKNINDLALQKNLALGGKFVASLDAAQASLASAEKNPTAIAKSMEQLRPLLQHASNYTVGLDRAVQNSPDKQFVKPRFDQQMNDAFDPLALQMKNSFDLGGKEGFDKFVKANKINLVEQQRLLGVLEKYKQLVNGVVK